MDNKDFGYFDDGNREFVITEPKTPFPWINYLGNEDFLGLISNTAGGYAFYKDAKFRRITRYRYNGVPMDDGGRYFYIKDGDTVWNPGWKPCRTPLDFYECRHGLSYTRITGVKDGVKASVLFFVPVAVHAEVHRLTLTNTTDCNKFIGGHLLYKIDEIEDNNDLILRTERLKGEEGEEGEEGARMKEREKGAGAYLA